MNDLTEKEQKAFDKIFNKWEAKSFTEIPNIMVYNRCLKLALKELIRELSNEECSALCQKNQAFIN